MTAPTAEEVKAFFAACSTGNANLVHTTLLKHSHLATIPSPQEDRQTALHFAASCNRTAVIDLLIHNGAAINARDAQGRTPLINAVRFQALDATVRLVELGADIEIKNDKGETAAFIAEALGQLAFVGALSVESRRRAILCKNELLALSSGITAPVPTSKKLVLRNKQSL